MFSNDQLTKISFFASMTKITNECFKKCININIEAKPELSYKEKDCLKNCSLSYVKLREFVEVQLLEDYESIQRKNKKIHAEET